MTAPRVVISSYSPARSSFPAATLLPPLHPPSISHMPRPVHRSSPASATVMHRVRCRLQRALRKRAATRKSIEFTALVTTEPGTATLKPSFQLLELIRAQSEKKVIPNYPIETAENPHPAIPGLTPWEARMVKTFLIGAPKKDLVHSETAAGRKSSKCSCLSSEDEGISAVERMLRLKVILSNQLRGYAPADGPLEACNLPKHRLEDIPAAKLIKKLQDFIAANLPPSPLNKEDLFPDIQYLDLRRSLRARQAWRAREVKRREELAAQMCKKAQRAWNTVAHMKKNRVKWEKEKAIKENKLDRLLDWQH